MHQSEDAIVVMLESMEEQAHLIERDPDHFYITDHYLGYAAVLVRLTLDESEFFELLEQAWRRVARRKDLREYENRP